MNLERLANLAYNSATRMMEASKRKDDPLFKPFVRKETSILLKRAWALWWGIRFGGKQ